MTPRKRRIFYSAAAFVFAINLTLALTTPGMAHDFVLIAEFVTSLVFFKRITNWMEPTPKVLWHPTADDLRQPTTLCSSTYDDEQQCCLPYWHVSVPGVRQHAWSNGKRFNTWESL